MSPETKQQALIKLARIRNKIGYPDKWRDYSSLTIVQDDFAGNIRRAGEFELHRQINKIGKPVDHGEWDISPAYRRRLLQSANERHKFSRRSAAASAL